MAQAKVADPQWYQLRDAVYQRDYASANALLEARSELLRLMNPIGETVLHFLAVENDTVGVQWLFEKGSDLNTRNAFGTPVLFEVAQVASEELFAWLVDHGADPRAVDQDGSELIEFLEKFNHHDRIVWVRKYLI